MTLEELVYQIDGELKVEKTEFADREENVKVSLLDNIRDVAVIRFRDRPNTDACATGRTLEEARQNLVNLVKGNVLVHSWPVLQFFQTQFFKLPMWKSAEATLRIPETLVA